MSLKIKAELLFILITLVMVALVLYPLYSDYGRRFAFYNYNIAFIFIFLTFTRYIFLLRYTPFSHNKWVKAVLLFLCIPLFILLQDGIYEFMTYIDNGGLITLAMNQASDASHDMAKYTRYQYLFFGAGCLIVLILLPIRMIVSIWRQVNKGTI
jgi:hypothetical protein